MGTPLGGVSAGQITATVKNNDTILLERGWIVALDTSASPTYIGAEQFVTPVTRADDSALKFFGVLNSNVGVGEVATVTIVGHVLCQTDDSVTHGDAIRPKAGTNTECLFEVWSTSGTKYGIALETDHTGKTTEDFALGAGGTTRYWAHCVVNFLADGGFGDT